MKKRYNINDLLTIMKRLRAPDGCPWDRKQTHKSIRRHLIEETYEFVDSVDSGNPEEMKEELGDILLHVVFHCEIERAKGGFTFNDVTDGISRKLIRRHPHVFKGASINGVDDVIKNWDSIKAGEKTKQHRRTAMDRVPVSMPAMEKTGKALHQARKAGIIGMDRRHIMEEIRSGTECLFSSDPKATRKKALGEVLFNLLALADLENTDAESGLNHACMDFMRKHDNMEKKKMLALKSGKK